MIKKALKKIAFWLYNTGYFESIRIQSIQRKTEFDTIATIANSAWISNDAILINKTQPKNKMRIGENSRIMGSLLVFDFDGEIEIGKDCFVGPNTKIWSARKIKIGDRVLIAHNVNIHDNISHPLDASERYLENLDFLKTGTHAKTDLKAAEIDIGSDVWIGFNSIILRGVKIGDGAIIGAGSMVTKDIEPWTVNAGNPLRVIRKLEPVEIV